MISQIAAPISNQKAPLPARISISWLVNLDRNEQATARPAVYKPMNRQLI